MQVVTRLKTHIASKLCASSIVLSYLVLSLASESANALSVPPHLDAAQTLLKKIDLDNTNYEHGQGTVSWDSPVSSHTDCSGFIDHLLMHTYGYSAGRFKKWLGSKRPTAKRYYDAIQAGEGFSAIRSIADLRPGDFIAVKYLTRTDNTGHIMVVAAVPERMRNSAPLVVGTEQWQVIVIDSSESGHGTTDSRHKKGPGGKDHDGLGQGVLRLYADMHGEVAGFSWSTLKSSGFKSPQDEVVAMGRLDIQSIP